MFAAAFFYRQDNCGLKFSTFSFFPLMYLGKHLVSLDFQNTAARSPCTFLVTEKIHILTFKGLLTILTVTRGINSGKRLPGNPKKKNVEKFVVLNLIRKRK